MVFVRAQIIKRINLTDKFLIDFGIFISGHIARLHDQWYHAISSVRLCHHHVSQDHGCFASCHHIDVQIVHHILSQRHLQPSICESRLEHAAFQPHQIRPRKHHVHLRLASLVVFVYMKHHY